MTNNRSSGDGSALVAALDRMVDMAPADGSGITYRIRVPSKRDRIRFQHALTASGVRQHSDAKLLGRVQAVLRALEAEAPEEAASGLAAVEAWIAARDVADLLPVEVRQAALVAAFMARSGFAWSPEGLDERDPEEASAILALVEAAARLGEVEAAVASGDDRFARMVADNEAWRPLYNMTAAAMFLAGWDGLDAPFRRGRDGVPDELLEALPDAHVGAIGDRVAELIALAENDAKNSPSPSSGAEPPISGSSTPSTAETETAPDRSPGQAEQAKESSST